jgi:ABC-type polysaccharide/polyol phosphate export permease
VYVVVSVTFGVSSLSGIWSALFLRMTVLLLSVWGVVLFLTSLSVYFRTGTSALSVRPVFNQEGK